MDYLIIITDINPYDIPTIYLFDEVTSLELTIVGTNFDDENYFTLKSSFLSSIIVSNNF